MLSKLSIKIEKHINQAVNKLLYILVTQINKTKKI